jgi:hypothetical protein
MHFESTTSFTDHGSTPLVECEMTRILIESCISLLPWSKHERCHARVLNQAVKNTASLARHLDLVPHRQAGQHVPVRRRRVASRLIGRLIVREIADRAGHYHKELMTCTVPLF